MPRKAANLAKQLAEIAAGTAGFEVRAGLETYLLDQLRSHGADAVIALFKQAPNLVFHGPVMSDSSGVTHFRIHVENRLVSVTLHLSPTVISVDVSREDSAGGTELEEDPRHEWFYAIWETLVGADSLAQPDTLRTPEREVAYIGLLEAEIMNGGLGQYLANTEGEYVRKTLELLRIIKAKRTHSALARAVKLRSATETYGDAWANSAQAFEELDAEIALDPEDLAALVANKYQ